MKIIIVLFFIILLPDANGAELKRMRLFIPSSNGGPNYTCTDGTPVSYYQFNAPATGMKIKQINRYIVGGDGTFGEYGFWLARGTIAQFSANSLFWDDGETIYFDGKSDMPARLFSTGENEITLQPNETFTYAFQCQFLGFMKTLGGYSRASHVTIPQIDLWYIEP